MYNVEKCNFKMDDNAQHWVLRLRDWHKIEYDNPKATHFHLHQRSAVHDGMSPSTIHKSMPNKFWLQCKLNVTSCPESLAAIRQASSLWGSMDMQAMFEICAPDDSAAYFIYAPTQWKFEASHVLWCKNRGSMTFLDRVVKVRRCLEIDVLYAAIREWKTLQPPYIVFPRILRKDNYGYILSTCRKPQSGPT